MREDTKAFILTDGCMWEKNKRDGTSFPHAIEAADAATGQVRYIKSGSRIAFLEGERTDARDQSKYNAQP